ncbi:MAG: hypothetical protein ACM359_17855, partial [Bacillota bacterium]
DPDLRYAPVRLGSQFEGWWVHRRRAIADEGGAMIWGKRDMMSNSIGVFRDLGWRLHSHLAAAATMFPFLMAPGRCAASYAEPMPMARGRGENDLSDSLSMDVRDTPRLGE